METTTAEANPLNALMIEGEVIEVLRTIYDPEIPVNIYEMGLIYDINVDPTGFVKVIMTLTSPACPVAGSLPPEVETKVKAASGVNGCEVEVTWDPPWTMEMMSEAAKLELGFF
jgi:FeS assembly SUF system protein